MLAELGWGPAHDEILDVTFLSVNHPQTALINLVY